MSRKRINLRLPPAAPPMTREEALAKVKIAGAAELRLSMNGWLGPHQHSRSWPQYLAGAAEQIDLCSIDAGRKRVELPSPEEAHFADQVSAVINARIADAETRLVLRARSMIHPLRGTHVRSFRAIARALGKDHKWARRRFDSALDILCRCSDLAELNQP